ncbi:thiamine pyrophosphate-binding protein [Paralimibaculum aggregatum]|uniref:Thiamine pyrophosphate-binding protein n=1 Tax=Paralimibaculum aggregatum TaxID=3036245 RepID=A0ABQ6LGJ5_9RHOB|nr:thiamine pyrophosphate-binding protein [Limibaculum sp. NKW23]GMG82122.1 thiamine pyrophosphate-binding protein [Limibaculum sp. NKW23]
MADLITGGEAVYRVLADQGVGTVFGLLGGSMLELYDAMHRGGAIRYVGARDERAAGHMADAHARITGGPGIVLGAQAGPGVVNLATAVAEAHLAYSPLVVIAGAISRRDLGKDTFQEIDQVALFAPICKRSVLVTEPARLAEMLRDAIRLAMSGRRGPVVLHVPRDIFAAQVSAPPPGPVRVARAGPPAPADLDAIAGMLAGARAPVIVAGGGFKWSGGTAALRGLAEALEIPVVASTGHADVMPHGHPLFAGQGGPRGNRVASRLTREADLLLVLGARLAFNSTFLSHDYVSAAARIVHVEIEAAAAGRHFPAELALQADARATAEALAARCARLPSDGWQAWRAGFAEDMASLRAERAAEAADPALPMHPRRALAEIRAALPEDAIVTLDTGNACLQAADRLAHYRAPGLVTPLDFGLVGFGYAAALGAKAAAPERPVLAVIGDGGFGFTLAEITTAVAHGLGVVAVVLDNGAWGAEKAYQQEFFGGRLLGAEIASPPYEEVARLCGALGFRAETPEALAEALRAALASGRPAVIHTRIDPDALSTLRKDLFGAQAKS